jgi:DNA-binding IscR family transcriptional regulator
VIEAIEGPIYLNVCLVGQGECSRDKICPVHAVWEEAQEKMMSVLDRANFADLARSEEQLQIRAS